MPSTPIKTWLSAKELLCLFFGDTMDLTLVYRTDKLYLKGSYDGCRKKLSVLSKIGKALK
ncbi:hypothetical protein HMPREF0322_04523 [Desulfitobacterium hafniense DP7]|uniref:Uncharacterized protein n=1 Tax=Desulfitobacterium hafniense DP7 TaxID=537010 RepID=G9XU65_DESHA|nr:hypothetical protein HMPREF0322_04523 [Desulfitobacterium hafniense DP7]